MNRREFLYATAAAASARVIDDATETLDVRVWVSEKAAVHGTALTRAVGYLRRALEDAFDSVEVTAGGSVPVPTEDAYRLMANYDWPRSVAAGAIGLSGVDASVGANLLVTNGDILRSTSGAGLPHFATMGGASHLARAPPADAVEGPVPMTLPHFAAQVVLHECGHALGLEHSDGTVRGEDAVRDDGPGGADGVDGPVVTPMVSGYAWASEDVRREAFGGGLDSCGNPLERASPARASLALTYSRCAVAELRNDHSTG